MQISDQLDECRKGHSEQQAHHTPQPAPEENPNRRRHRPDTHAIGNKFWNKEIRGYDMEEEDRENDDDEWYGCVELKEGRCKWKSKRSDQSEEGQQIQEPAGDSERYGTSHAKSPQHQRGRHSHHGPDDKVSGDKAANHLVQVRDESSRIHPGIEEAIHPDCHLILGAEHKKR